MIPPPPLNAFKRTSETYLGKMRQVYRLGDAGPGVVLLHEIPGMTLNVLRLARLIAQGGFRVVLPSLFGIDGRSPSTSVNIRSVLRMCISAEFAVFAANGSSPITDWLRELCKAVADDTGGPIGVVGLCITGGFALSLTVGTDGSVHAPIMSEPSLPFPAPFTAHPASVHLSPEEQELVRAATHRCMALRFTGDSRCPRDRFDTYEQLLGRRLTRIEIASPDAAHGIKADAHSVLTEEFSDAPGHPTWAAFQNVIEFLKATLAPGSVAPQRARGLQQ